MLLFIVRLRLRTGVGSGGGIGGIGEEREEGRGVFVGGFGLEGMNVRCKCIRFGKRCVSCLV